MTRRPLTLTLLALLAGLAAAPARADTLRVPQDFASIQGAVAAAADGDEILISKGSYDPFVIDGRNDLTVRAKGKVVLTAPLGADGASVAAVIVDSSGIVLSRLRFESIVGDAVTVDSSNGVLLEKLRIDSVSGYGIWVTGSNDVTVEKTRIEITGADGIRTDACTGVTVDRCLIRYAGNDGVAFSAGNPAEPTHGSVVCRTRILDPGDDGVDVDGDGNLFERVIVKGAGEDGFEVDKDGAGSGNTFLMCRAIKPDYRGFAIYGSANTLEKCISIQVGHDAIVLRGAGGHTATSCKSVKPWYDGLYTSAGSDGNTLTGNRVVSPGDDGIDVRSSGNLIEGNKVGGADQFGFEVTETGNTFTGNKIKGSKQFDIFDSELGLGNTYTDNTLKTSNLL